MSRTTLKTILFCLLCLQPAILSAQSLSRLEYWFDDDFDGRSSVALSGSAQTVNLSLSTDGLDNGVHRLSYRAKRSDGMYSAISTSMFFKQNGSSENSIEYWIDNDYDQRVSLPLANTDEEQELTFDLSDSELYPLGFHQLHFRVSTKGKAMSATYTTGIMKLPMGAPSKLEYWFDNDTANAQILTGNKASDGKDYIFNTDLNLDGVNPGHHRLYYRAVGDSRQTASAIMMTPVIVKSKYSMLPNEVKMNAFTYAIDNETPIVVKVERDDELILNPFTIDIRDLKEGEHTLTAHFWNTANAGVGIEKQFKVKALETPTITLTAEEEGGIVKLKFNSVPNDVKWAVVRVDANGVGAKVGGRAESRYPSMITLRDTPPVAGAYTYKARGYYMDSDGVRRVVNSNEVEVSVTNPEATAYGNISGQILIDGKRPRAWGNLWNIEFSDGDAIITGASGDYYRGNIPVGTELTITTKNYDYTSDTLTITVKEGTNYVTHDIHYDEAGVRRRYTSDLIFDSDVEFEPCLHMKFRVKNNTRLTWKGKICIVTGRKEFVDNPPKNPFEQGGMQSGSQSLAGSVASFVRHDCYQHDYSEPLFLLPGESTDVFIKHNVPLSNVPSATDELYYFFVQSIDEFGTKLIAINDDYNIKENPLVQLVDNGVCETGEEEVETVVNTIMALCSTVVEFDGKLGDMSKCMTEMEETLGYTLDYYKLSSKIENASSYSQLLNEIPAWKFYNILFQEDRRFLGMVNSVRDNIAKEVRAAKNVLGYLKNVKKCIDWVKGYQQWQDMNELERTGHIAERILKMTEEQFPFAKILQMYLDVTKTTIKNINGLATKWYENTDYHTFREGPEIYPGSEFGFDIRVKKKVIGSFDEEDVRDAILSAEITCIGHIQGNDRLTCTASYTPVVEDGECRLQLLSISGDNDTSGGNVVPIEDMWMTIHWRNGRVSQVPIRRSDEVEGDGVKRNKNHYIITFQSKTRDEEHLADIIHLDD